MMFSKTREYAVLRIADVNNLETKQLGMASLAENKQRRPTQDCSFLVRLRLIADGFHECVSSKQANADAACVLDLGGLERRKCSGCRYYKDEIQWEQIKSNGFS